MHYDFSFYCRFYGEEDKVNKNHVPKVTTREKRKKWGQTPFKTIQEMKRTDKVLLYWKKMDP